VISPYSFQRIQFLEKFHPYESLFTPIKLSSSFSSLIWYCISIINVHETLIKLHWDWHKKKHWPKHRKWKFTLPTVITVNQRHQLLLVFALLQLQPHPKPEPTCRLENYLQTCFFFADTCWAQYYSHRVKLSNIEHALVLVKHFSLLFNPNTIIHWLTQSHQYYWVR